MLILHGQTRGRRAIVGEKETSNASLEIRLPNLRGETPCFFEVSPKGDQLKSQSSFRRHGPIPFSHDVTMIPLLCLPAEKSPDTVKVVEGEM
jgi:hypothetical protein